ncbi:MarR family winged helix-turn-helix transcriptional regulator [Streptomyces sp. NPDC001770]
MEYSHSDAELVEQPIGYWSWAAHKAVVTNIRAGLAEFGVTQPQWWVLNQVAADENGRTRAQVTAVLQGYLDVGASLANEIDGLLGRHLLTLDGEDRLRPTSEGDAVRRRCAQRQTEMRKQAHDGITDEEYVITLKVLQRMIHNVGGEAWHH